MNDYSKVPEGLKARPQWVTFKLVPNEKKGKPDKIPYDPRTGYRAKANDPRTWTDYSTAIQALQRGGYDGIGFEFGGGVFGVDLDNVVQPDGRLTPEAQDIISTLDSYTEYSPSGLGIHVLCVGTIPEKDRRRGNVEMYAEGRFFTVTGKVYGTPKGLEERTAQAAAVHAKYIKREDPPAPSAEPVAASDNDLLYMAMTARNGAAFKALWEGDISGYPSHSEADLALCNLLAYWTNGDAARMDALFRASGLCQGERMKKWDRRHGADTYGNLTIKKALEGFTPYTGQPLDWDSTIGGPASSSTDAAAAVTAEALALISKENPRPDAVGAYLEKGLIEDIKHFVSFKDRKTGFANLDAHTTGLYPGLYVVGAISSLGKTTFTHQLGDQLAAAGDHVLFFSLEQSRLEMVTKSLSRLMAKKDKATAVSAIKLRSGIFPNAAADAAEEYKKIADRVSVIECNFDTNIKFIMEYTKAYMGANPGIRPVLIVDYLQIIPPMDPRQTEREKVDSIVRGLKKLQSDNSLVVFVVSSINRSNYLTPIDFESFKESGGIEYTADVVWGLQLAVLNDSLFNTDKKIKEKREAVKEAKLAIPRKIELVCLKNRYGVASYTCNFSYDPRFDLFEPAEDEVPPPQGKVY